jgi:hypothetical protein
MAQDRRFCAAQFVVMETGFSPLNVCIRARFKALHKKEKAFPC